MSRADAPGTPDRGIFHIVGAAIGWGDDRDIPPGLQTREPDCRRIAAVAINAALSLLLAALAANASRRGNAWAVDAFYASMAWAFLPAAFVAFRPGSSRGERFTAVMLVTVALYIVRMIREPVAFIDHDEFLHWTTANHMLDAGRLFSPNALLPVSARYPGLEIVTTAIVSLSDLSVFQAATCVLAVVRVIFVASLFLAYERFSNNARIAAGACLVYMGSSTFLVFDTQFSYESMALVFVAAGVLSEARSRAGNRLRNATFVTVPLVAALAVTHHMTAYFLAMFLVGLVVLELLKAPPRHYLLSSMMIAAFAIAAPLAWSKAMGDPGAGYLGPVLANGLQEVAHLLTFSAGRKLFVAADGYIAPAWQRHITFGSVGLVCLGLAVGFFRSLALGGLSVDRQRFKSLRLFRSWHSSAVLLLTLLTVAYPIGMLFRLTKSGWEIGNRIGPFAFVGVGFVVAVGVVTLLRRPSTVGALSFTLAALVVLVGGVISAEGPRILVPAKFKVSADSASISKMNVDAAEWTRAWLGERNLFTADRITRLLLSTYGRQDVASTLQDGYDTSDAVLALTLGVREKDLLRTAGIDYLAVDLRITTALPSVGAYFDGGDMDRDYRSPPSASSLLKFDAEPAVGRVFDDGYILIYDMRLLDGAR